MKISIIIVNYNGKHFLADCVASIGSFVPTPYELIIVDNASVDGSADYIAESLPGVKLIRSDRNLGFTGGNNLGAKYATGELLLLLNNDTLLKSSIDPMIAAFSDPKLGVLGCRLFYGNGQNQPSVGYAHTPLRIVLSWIGAGRNRWMPTLFKRAECATDFYTSSHDQVAWVSGACLLTPRVLWERLGGLDERYFMYVEDVDYCKRVRDLGFRVAYTPSVEVIHYEGAGKEWIGAAALQRTTRSYLIYLTKNNGKVVASCTGLVLALVLSSRCLAYSVLTLIRREPLLADKLRGYWAAAGYLAKNSVLISRNIG